MRQKVLARPLLSHQDKSFCCHMRFPLLCLWLGPLAKLKSQGKRCDSTPVDPLPQPLLMLVHVTKCVIHKAKCHALNMLHICACTAMRSTLCHSTARCPCCFLPHLQGLIQTARSQGLTETAR